MKRLIFRLLTGCAFALPLMLVSVALAQTETGSAPDQTQDCRECHAGFHAAWAGGAHGPAPATFRAAWEQQGESPMCLNCHELEGIACATCHALSDGHPDAVAFVDRSAETCGACHAESYLGWQVSQHGRKDMVCVNCHDSHATANMKGGPSTLCSNCHESRSQDFAHSSHNQVGLACADCHLTPPDDLQDPHSVRDHSFNVKLSTCNGCHVSEIHTAIVVTEKPVLPTPTPDAMSSGAVSAGVSAIPEPVGPLGFAVLALVIGFGAGIVLFPWLERWYRTAGRTLWK